MEEGAQAEELNATTTEPTPSTPGEHIQLQPGQVAVIPGVIAKAIVAIQAKVSPLARTAENPHFKNAYVPLSDVMREALQLLSEHKLGITQWPVSDGEKTVLITVLMHESGASISGQQELLLVRRDSQGQGSAMTYARRYGIMAILGLVGDDDDDGNKAANRQTKPTPEQLSEIRQLCIDLKFSPDQVEARITSLRTEDQAVVALNNLHNLIADRAKRIGDEGKAIPVFTGSRDDHYPPADGGTDGEGRMQALKRRLLALGLPDQKRRQFVNDRVGKPFFEKCLPDELDKLEAALTELEEQKADGITPPEDTA